MSKSAKSSEENLNEVKEAINTLVKEETMNNKLPEVGSEWICKLDETKHQVVSVDPSSNWPIRTKTQEGGGGSWSTCYFDRNFKPALELPEVDFKNTGSVKQFKRPTNLANEVWSQIMEDKNVLVVVENDESREVVKQELEAFRVDFYGNNSDGLCEVYSLDSTTKPIITGVNVVMFAETGKSHYLTTMSFVFPTLSSDSYSMQFWKDDECYSNTAEPMQSSSKSGKFEVSDTSTVSTPTDKPAVIKKKPSIFSSAFWI